MDSNRGSSTFFVSFPQLFEENMPTFPQFDDVLRKSFRRFEEKWQFLRKSFRFQVLNSEEKLKCTIYYISVGCFHRVFYTSTFAITNIMNPSCVRVPMG